MKVVFFYMSLNISRFPCHVITFVGGNASSVQLNFFNNMNQYFELFIQ